jgi:hypothetical protein
VSRGHGITNKQASYLASLQRAAGEPYTGAGMSRERASVEIERLLEQLRQERLIWGGNRRLLRADLAPGSEPSPPAIQNGPPAITRDLAGARRCGDSAVGAEP